MSRRCDAIEKGLGLLSGDLRKPRYLKEGQPGFQEILEVIAQRGPKLERTEFSAIRYGRAGAEGSVERVHVALESRTSSPPQYDTIATREVFERWLYDSRYKTLSLCGFSFVFCGVFLGVVSLIMQALESRSC